MSNIFSLQADKLYLSEMGQAGVDYITDTAEHEGEWRVIYAITDTVFTGLLQEGAYVNGTATADVATSLGSLLTAGKEIRGKFTSITLTSGSVAAYR